MTKTLENTIREHYYAPSLKNNVRYSELQDIAANAVRAARLSGLPFHEAREAAVAAVERRMHDIREATRQGAAVRARERVKDLSQCMNPYPRKAKPVMTAKEIASERSLRRAYRPAAFQGQRHAPNLRDHEDRSNP